MSASEIVPATPRRSSVIEFSEDELDEMGVEVAGHEPAPGGPRRSKSRSVIRVPDDEVPRQPGDLGSASTAPQRVLSHTDALVERAFENLNNGRATLPTLPIAVAEAEDDDDDLHEDGEGIEPLEDDMETERTVISAPPVPPPNVPAPIVDHPTAPLRSTPPPPMPAAVTAPPPVPTVVPAVASAPQVVIEEPIEDGAVLSSSPPHNLMGPRVAVAFASSGEVVDGAATVHVAAPPAREEDEELHFDEIEEVKVPPLPPSTAATPTPPSAPPPSAPPQAMPQAAPPHKAPASAAPAIPSEKPATPPALPNTLTPPSVAAAPSATSDARRKRRAKQWFEEIFDEDYLRTFPFMTPAQTEREAGFLADALQLGPAASVLDVGCGYGRHAMELAGRGHQVTGLDLSLPLLIRAADAARRVGATINFIHGDMREMTYEGEYDAAYCYFTTFGYFDDETNRSVAGLISRALKPGGRFLLDVVNRDYIVRDLPVRVWWQGDGCMVLEEVDFNYFTSRLKVQRSIVFEDGRQVEQELSIRAYSLHEIGKVLHHAGFRVLEVSGGLAAKGKFFGGDSRQIVVVAEKKKES